MNLRRRQLSASQKAAAAVELEPWFAKEAKERMREGGNIEVRKGVIKLSPAKKGKSRNLAAKAVGVSPAYVSRAKKLKKENYLFHLTACEKVESPDFTPVCFFHKPESSYPSPRFVSGTPRIGNHRRKCGAAWKRPWRRPEKKIPSHDQ